MKKVFLTFAFVAAAFFCQAQLFVGGSLGFGVTGGNHEHNGYKVDNPKGLTFTIHPNLGYMFSDRIGAGVDFGYGLERIKEDVEGEDLKVFAHSWSVTPYFRYVFVNWDPIKIYGDLQVSFGGTKNKAKYDGVSIDGNKVFNFGAQIIPGIAYAITDNLSMNAQVYLFGIGYSLDKTTYENDSDYPDGLEKKDTAFGFLINENTPLTIGFFYTF